MSKKTQLDQDFRDIVHAFCKRNNMTPEQIANKAGYTNRERIADCFTYNKTMINDKTKNRFVDVMKTFEPDLVLRTFAVNQKGE